MRLVALGRWRWVGGDGLLTFGGWVELDVRSLVAESLGDLSSISDTYIAQIIGRSINQN